MHRGWVAAVLLGGMGAAQALPLISLEPLAPVSISIGDTVSLSVSASGASGLRYQWRRNGANIAGATGPGYTISNFQVTDGGSYSVVVADDQGITTSQAARLVPTTLQTLAAADSLGSALARISVLLGSDSRRASNSNATREAGEPNHAGKRGQKSVWFKWRPTLSGIAKLNTTGSDFDTLLAVYTGTSVADLVLVADNDDSGGYFNSQLSFNTEGGTDYLVAVAGLGEASGNIIFNWDFQLSSDLLPKLLTKPKSKSGRLGSLIDLLLSATNGGTVQVEWKRNGQVVAITPDMLSLDNLMLSDVGSYSARIFDPTTGKEIFTEPVSVQIHQRPDGSFLADVLAWNKYAEANDTLAAQGPQLASLGRGSRRRLNLARGYSGTQVFNTYGATTEEGEPHHCGVVGGASQWFGYQAEANGLLTVDTEGSDFDTVLAVYTGDGTSYSTLQEVACNNDYETNRWSRVQFQATGGTIYYIAVDGVNAATGMAVINYNLDPPPVIFAIADQATEEDTPKSIAFTISDIGTATANLVLASSSSNAGLFPGGNLSLSGTDGNRTLTLTPAADQSGTATVTITVYDAWTNATESFAVTVNPVNDAPALAGPGQIDAAREINTPLTGFTISDVDAGGSPVVLTLAAGQGTLTVSGSVAGGVTAGQISNNGAATVQVTASLAAINATLAHSSGLIYRGNNGFTGADTLTLGLNDNGNSGSGGAQTGTGSVNLTVYSHLSDVWRQDEFSPEDLADSAKESTVWGNQADPDRDGRDNLMEYALGLSPTEGGDGSAGISSGLSPVSGSNYSSLTFKRRRNDPNLQYVPEVSADQQTWFSGGSYVQESARTNLDTDFEMVTYRDLTAVAPGTPRFFRLRVVQNN